MRALPTIAVSRWAGYTLAVVACAAATAVVMVLPRELWLPSGVLVYLLTVLGIAVILGRGPALVASLVSLAAFDFFFTEPRYTFTIDSAHEWIALTA